MTDTPETTWLTAEAYERLTAELANRETVVRKDITAKIEAAREEGDLRENGGYHAAKEDQGHNEARIRQLKHLLEHAQVGTPPEAAEGKATHGTVVTVRFAGDSDTERYLLASREEAGHSELAVFSPSSPIGQALLGAQAGDTVTYQLPNGQPMSVDVVAVEPLTG